MIVRSGESVANAAGARTRPTSNVTAAQPPSRSSACVGSLEPMRPIPFPPSRPRRDRRRSLETLRGVPDYVIGRTNRPSDPSDASGDRDGHAGTTLAGTAGRRKPLQHLSPVLGDRQPSGEWDRWSSFLRTFHNVHYGRCPGSPCMPVQTRGLERNRRSKPHRVTIHRASTTIALEIFDSPNARSRNVIGASPTANPSRWLRRTSSTWNP